MSEERLAQGQEYVERLRAKGRSDDAIREKMREAGWKDELVDQVVGGAPAQAEDSAGGWALDAEEEAKPE